MTKLSRIPARSRRLAVLLCAQLAILGLIACQDDPAYCDPLVITAAVPANGNATLGDLATQSQAVSVLGVPHVRVQAQQTIAGVDYGVEVHFASATGVVSSVQCFWVDSSAPPPNAGGSCLCSTSFTPCAAGAVSADQARRTITFTNLVFNAGGVSATLNGAICY